MRRWLCILVATLCATTVFADGIAYINPDARSTAMGGATMAVSGDAYAVFNNPASPLLEYRFAQASFAYTLLSNKEYSKYRSMALGGYVKFGQRHALSVGGQLLFEPRNEQTSLRANTKGLALGYGYKVSDRTSLALTARYYHYADGGNVNSNAVCFDAGFLTRIPVEIYNGSIVGIGAKLSGAGFWWGKTMFEQPLSLVAGTSLALPIRDNHSIELALDAGYCFTPRPARSYVVNVGAEYVLSHVLRFRCGGHIAKSDSYGSVGLGVRFFHLQFDVAYTLAAPRSPMHNAVQFCAGLDF